MAEYDLGFKLRQDGSIDFDAYRADAARERREVRNHLIWEVGFPLFWDAPARLVAKAMKALACWHNALRLG
jgi:hypothetical protein